MCTQTHTQNTLKSSQSFMDDDVIIQDTCILSCRRLFTLDLPGVHMLIPYAIAAAARVLNPDYNTKKTLPFSLRSACLTLFFSVLCHPHYYGTTPFVDLGAHLKGYDVLCMMYDVLYDVSCMMYDV